MFMMVVSHIDMMQVSYFLKMKKQVNGRSMNLKPELF